MYLAILEIAYRFTVAGGQHRIGTRRQIIGKRGVFSRGGRGKAGEGEQSEKGKRSGRTGQAEKTWQIGHKYPTIISFVFTPPYGGVNTRGAIATASSCRTHHYAACGFHSPFLLRPPRK